MRGAVASIYVSDIGTRHHRSRGRILERAHGTLSLYFYLQHTMSQRISQISGHLTNSAGRGLLAGEVAIITCVLSSEHSCADRECIYPEALDRLDS